MSNITRLILILSVPFILFSVVGYVLAGFFGAFSGLVLFGVFNIFLYYYSENIIIRMYCARPLSREKYPIIHKSVFDLSKNAEISEPQLYIVDADTPSAFVCGMKKPFVIAVTSGLVQVCDEREVEAVIAREFAQIMGGHVLVSTLSSMFSLSLLYPFEKILGYCISKKKGYDAIFRIPALIVAPFAAVFVRAANRASFSIELDGAGAKLSKKPACLSSALEKISREVKYRPLKVGSHATTALFISNPFNGSLLSKFFLVHPTLEVRIAGLKKLVI
ncbi:MAG: M48 family metalloprotease [Nanohaloarchaea archaeon]|nr:M48 family metalloprotease [Candidatus Nanohaloarchaea archaeon]